MSHLTTDSVSRSLLFRVLPPLLVLLLLLTGCAGRSAPDPVPETQPSQSAPPSTEESAPESLVFNGVSYPLDAEELTAGSVGELEQLRWAGSLRRLTLIVSEPIETAPLAGLNRLEELTVLLSGADAMDLDLSALALPSLTSLSIQADCPIRELLLPAAPLESCSITLAESAVLLDCSAPTNLRELHVDVPGGAGRVVYNQALESLDCWGFTPDPSALAEASGLTRLSLTEPDDLSFLLQLPSVRFLGLYSRSGRWNLTPLIQTELTQLAAPSCGADELGELAGMATLESLQISDAAVQDLSVLNGLPTLKHLIVSVASGQTLEQRELTAEDASLLEQVETTLSKEQLTLFLRDGGTIRLVTDANR